ncbi:hypothetical protein V6Z11_D03G159000 [Gossypium hirsutum]
MKNFNYCSTLRGPSHSLAARILAISIDCPRIKRMRQEFIRTSYRKLHKELGLHCLSIQHLDQVSGTCLFLQGRLNWLESDSSGNQLRTRNKRKKMQPWQLGHL